MLDIQLGGTQRGKKKYKKAKKKGGVVGVKFFSSRDSSGTMQHQIHLTWISCFMQKFLHRTPPRHAQTYFLSVSGVDTALLRPSDSYKRRYIAVSADTTAGFPQLVQNIKLKKKPHNQNKNRWLKSLRLLQSGIAAGGMWGWHRVSPKREQMSG